MKEQTFKKVGAKNKSIAREPLKLKVGSNPHTKTPHKANVAMFSTPLHGKKK